MRAKKLPVHKKIVKFLSVNHNKPALNVTAGTFGQDTAPDYLLDLETKKVFMELTLSGMGFLLNPRDTKFEDLNPC